MPSHVKSMARAPWDLSIYAEVARQRAGRTVGFFALLLFFSALLVAGKATIDLRSFLREQVVPELHKLPIVTIKGGQASANVAQPWRKEFSDENSHLKSILVIDTTGQVTAFAPDEQGFILTKTELLMKNAQNMEQRTFELAQADDITIEPTTLQKWAGWALVICFFGALVFMFIYWAFAKLFFALVLSLAGLIASATRPRPISYGQIFTVSIYALVPAIALDLLLMATHLGFSGSWLAYLAVGCAFTVLGVRKVPDELPPAAAAPPPPASNLPGPAPQPPVTF
jgi:hypothetical protein